MRPSTLVARWLGCTEGQAATILVGAVVAIALLMASVPPALTEHVSVPPPPSGIEPPPPRVGAPVRP